MDLEHKISPPTGDRKPLPVLLLHGAWHGAWCYDQWRDDFAAHGYETHAMSLPAHGESPYERSINWLSMRDYVKALAAVVKMITPTPIVIGHSLGGAILQHYLREHGAAHPLPAAVLMASIPVGGTIPFYLRYARRHPLRYFGAIFTANLKLMIETPALAREWFISDDATITPEALSARLGNESLRAGLEVVLPIRVRRGHGTLMLVLAAERDPLFSVKEERRTAEKHNAAFEVIDGASHDVMIEHGWQATTARIREWIEGNV
jgi:pimeloyl-ACP methyl ester carboxylesterase